jgi:hypothetical protein
VSVVVKTIVATMHKIGLDIRLVDMRMSNAWPTGMNHLAAPHDPRLAT